jgi:polyisoprenyl-phosphate glycosyltransferase
MKDLQINVAAPVELSVVVPLLNEAGNLPTLAARLLAACAATGLRFEVLFVDDGSSDGSWDVIGALSLQHPAIGGIRLVRNFGHQKALIAGLTHARGAAIVSLDADLQHPPELIPELVAQWQQGAAVVATRRLAADETGWFKRTTSDAYYHFFGSISGIPLSAGSSDFRLVARNVRDALLSCDDADLFIRGLVQWLGYPTAVVDYRPAPRFSGSTKYTIRRMLRFARSGVIAFSTKPLQAGIWLGAVTALLAIVELGYILVRFLQGETVPGWASTVGIVALFAAIQLFVLGLVGVYVAQIHQALQSRPKFLVSQTLKPRLD